MLILLRKTTLENGAVTAQTDIEISEPVIRLGASPDATVPLYGTGLLPDHCELAAQSGGRFNFTCNGDAAITRAGERLTDGILEPAADFEIGPHRVIAMPPPPGFDAALEVEIDADAAGSSRLRYANDIKAPMPPTRKIAWGLALLVLTLGLLLPLLSHYQSGPGQSGAGIGLPTDHFWLSGPLAGAHQLAGIGDDCRSCHVKAFEMVTDQTCVGCHDATPAHISANHPDNAQLTTRCAGCHREHNEPGNLVIGHNNVCTDCHINEQHRTDTADTRGPIGAVTEFSSGSHPEFLLNMLRPANGGWLHERRQTIADKPAEQSNLKFPHDLHLDAEKVTAPDSDAPLACESCHTLAKDGEHFTPITMEATCSECHSLAFDPNQPDREMPHAAPAAVYTQLKEYFTASVAAAADGIQIQRGLRRAPGKQDSVAADNSDPCVGTVRQCGLQIAAEEMQRLFMHTGCVTCHEVAGAGDQWQVKPVRINDDWYSGSDFNHRPHLNAALGDEDSQCLNCHEADQSDDSAHILIPGVENCLQCHDTGQRNSSKLMCLDCHGFHDSDHALMVPVTPNSRKEEMP